MKFKEIFENTPSDAKAIEKMLRLTDVKQIEFGLKNLRRGTDNEELKNRIDVALEAKVKDPKAFTIKPSGYLHRMLGIL